MDKFMVDPFGRRGKHQRQKEFATTGSEVYLRRQLSYTRWLVTGSIVLALAILLVYYPSLNLGFRGEIWKFVELAAKLNLQQYASLSFDPSVQVSEYRPLRNAVVLGEFVAFRFSVFGYHSVRTLVHLANVLVLSAIVLRISKNPKLAFVSGALYGALPVYTQAIFDLADPQPEASLFYLLSVLCWIAFLRCREWKYYVVTVLSFILALAGKETSATLIVTLFLVDRLLIRQPTNLKGLFQRYGVFFLVQLFYLGIEYIVQSNGYFFGTLGWGVGTHVVSNFARYFTLLLFPWGLAEALVLPGALISVLLFAFSAIRKPAAVLAFLILEAILLVAPYVWAPSALLAPRYLYLPSTLSAIAFALVFIWLSEIWGNRRLVQLSAALVIGLILFINSNSIKNVAADWNESVRRSRVPFHDIAMRHETFPTDTYLYFIDPPSIDEMSDLILSRYGENVWVGSSVDSLYYSRILSHTFQRMGIVIPTAGFGASQIAGLRNHQTTYVYYFESTGKPVEVAVQKDAITRATPSLPVAFNGLIRLEGYEITANSLKGGDPLVLLLYWRATQKVEKDYTVFVHLVDDRGEIVGTFDSQPRSGQAPTSTWHAGVMVVDSIVIPLPSNMPSGTDYHLEIGLYYLPTMERIGAVDSRGTWVDKIVVEPFRVE